MKESWPTSLEQYEKIEIIGKGGSAEVWRGLARQGDARNGDEGEGSGRECAIKVVDLSDGDVSMDILRKEILNLGLTDCPEVVKYHTSFVSGMALWMVMDFMDGGSILDIMKFKYPDGLDEATIATVLLPSLKGIAYFHRTDRIHRDIKAGNILISTSGVVKLADLGVAAFMVESGGLKKVAQTFVGTPNWMAPEVMEQATGHSFAADIWSFGMTTLELLRGQAPFARFPPLKVMLMVINEDPPTVKDEELKSGRCSKALKDLVDVCLSKDPSKRPTSEKLIGHKFFSKGKDAKYLVGGLLANLPPLGKRYQVLRAREAEEKAADLNKGRNSDAGAGGDKEGGAGDKGDAWDFGEDDTDADKARSKKGKRREKSVTVGEAIDDTGSKKVQVGRYTLSEGATDESKKKDRDDDKRERSKTAEDLKRADRSGKTTDDKKTKGKDESRKSRTTTAAEIREARIEAEDISASGGRPVVAGSKIGRFTVQENTHLSDSGSSAGSAAGRKERSKSMKKSGESSGLGKHSGTAECENCRRLEERIRDLEKDNTRLRAERDKLRSKQG